MSFRKSTVVAVLQVGWRCEAGQMVAVTWARPAARELEAVVTV